MRGYEQRRVQEALADGFVPIERLLLAAQLHQQLGAEESLLRLGVEWVEESSLESDLTGCGLQRRQRFRRTAPRTSDVGPYGLGQIEGQRPRDLGGRGRFQLFRQLQRRAKVAQLCAQPTQQVESDVRMGALVKRNEGARPSLGR